MQEIDKRYSDGLSSFDQMGGSSNAEGMHDWAVPWSDLMMVMFVLFVVLFIYADTHQDVKVLFSNESSEQAKASSSLDPLIGLIGQIASRADTGVSQERVSISSSEVLFRSRSNGVSVVREDGNRIRVTLRGALFFDPGLGGLKEGANQYLSEIAEVIRLSVGVVHVIGYASEDEAEGAESFALSTQRASDVAQMLISRFEVDPKRVTITGRGSYTPEIPGTTEVNRASNRRVEIVITNEI
ncbi:OmpA family protein [Pseudodesulfovibrio cashew]|uniref:OmpA family protein n=1 Tax=Pseudodesulfovibrio cashew TaxID=2678688 RepID=A0A6I6JIW0_9BACT|nr:OmpA family protein [Pseudodesulfovibrio cashew]QGY41079.1 OmpA family protein [Pseudodesulfovibrio cashew]